MTAPQVYFITSRDLGMVKIGYAKNAQERFHLVQVHCPVELKLERVLEGSLEKEAELHERFADCRRRGEWFEITPALDAFMATLPKHQWRHRGWQHAARRAEAVCA